MVAAAWVATEAFSPLASPKITYVSVVGFLNTSDWLMTKIAFLLLLIVTRQIPGTGRSLDCAGVSVAMTFWSDPFAYTMTASVS